MSTAQDLRQQMIDAVLDALEAPLEHDNCGDCDEPYGLDWRPYERALTIADAVLPLVQPAVDADECPTCGCPDKCAEGELDAWREAHDRLQGAVESYKRQVASLTDIIGSFAEHIKVLRRRQDDARREADAAAAALAKERAKLAAVCREVAAIRCDAATSSASRNRQTQLVGELLDSIVANLTDALAGRADDEEHCCGDGNHERCTGCPEVAP